MKDELIEIFVKEYNGVENYVLKQEEGIGFNFSYTDELNMGNKRTNPFFISPDSGKYLFDAMFKLNPGDIVISGFLNNDLTLIYSIDVTNSKGENSYVGTITDDVTKLYTTGPDKAFERNTIEYVKDYVNNVVKYLKGETESVEYKELSKFVFEELKYKYNAL